MKYKLNLHLFAGEGGGAAAAAGDGASQGEAAQAAANLPGVTRRGKSGDLSNVLYGSEADAVEQPQAAAGAQEPDVQTTSNTLEERRQAFRDMVTGEYKDVYGEEVQRLIDRRFAETKNLQKQVDDAKPILDKLAARYNVLDGDMSKLAKALEDDHSYWTAAAEEAGMPEDVYREVQMLRQQNAQILRMQQQREQAQAANARVQQWIQEGQAVKANFPNFDLAKEMENPRFMSLLRSGTPVEHAYKVMHFDELMGEAVQTASKSTEKAVVNNIRAKGSRPAENGTASQSPFTVKRSVHQLSKADREEAIRRSMSGTMITFNS